MNTRTAQRAAAPKAPARKTQKNLSPERDFDPGKDEAYLNGSRLTQDRLDALVASIEDTPPVRRGRPRLDDKTDKTAGHSPRLETRVPENIHSAVVAAAARDGVRTSEWLRQAVLAKLTQ